MSDPAQQAEAMAAAVRDLLEDGALVEIEATAALAAGVPESPESA